MTESNLPKEVTWGVGRLHFLSGAKSSRCPHVKVSGGPDVQEESDGSSLDGASRTASFLSDSLPEKKMKREKRYTPSEAHSSLVFFFNIIDAFDPVQLHK